MTTCSKCKATYTPLCKCPDCGQDDSTGPTAVVECPKVCSATIYVQDSLKGAGVDKIGAKLDGGAPKPTDVHGFSHFKDLQPGAHAASLSLTGLEDKYAWPIGNTGDPVSKTIAVQENEFYAFTVDPLTTLKVTVKRRHDSNGIPGAKVTIKPQTTGNTVATAEETTPAGGEVTFKRLREDSYQLTVALDDTAKAKFVPDKESVVHPLDMSKNPDELVLWVRLVIHLRLKYMDPDDTARAFPKDFPLQVVFNDASTVDLKVLDDKGYCKFEVPDAAKTKFTLKFDSTQARYLVHEAGKATSEVRLDPTDNDLRTLTDTGRSFFALPNTWSLVQSRWDATGCVVPQDGQIDVLPEGIGTEAAPAELTLRPRLQYVRFQYFDRKYAHSDHGDSQISIPPVVLRAARESDGVGSPVNGVAGSHDLISNWMVDAADDANACQCLPWVISRKSPDGADLPKFNNKLLLEFGEADTWVRSTSATERKTLIIPSGDDRLKPNRDRNQYYDLPAQWKSTCYYTRFSDATKNRLFNELADTDDADLEASYSKATKLSFSLDDVVLVDGASQDIEDEDSANYYDVSGDSRVTVLYLDPADKYKVKVHKPRDKAAYWSKSEFVVQAGTASRRNLIIDLPIGPRVVVFCNGFYDVHDKRTTSADFGKKQILGARAAMLHDTTISSGRQTFDDPAAVTNHYVHRARAFHLHYLHFGATDGTIVYAALVTYWTCRITPDLTNATVVERGTHADVDVFREEGMQRAMDRWNEKDYYFEEADDKRELVVKHFCLFEAKDVWVSSGNFIERGGGEMCKVTVISDEGRSSAGMYSMKMRKSGAVDEGDDYGPLSVTNTLSPSAEYDAADAPPRSTFAHELGHAAMGLWDDYITDEGKLQYTSVATWNDNDDDGDRQAQRYLGMPYDIDAVPLMKKNRALRLRYFWGRVKWLNDQSVGGLTALLGGRRFRAASEPTGGAAKLKYARPAGAAFDSIYVPSVPAIVPAPPWSLGNHGRCDLFLYHLGEDEFSKTLNGGPYNGLLVVGIKLAVCFRVPAFSGNTDYKAGDIVDRNGAQYKCRADQTSGLLAGFGSSMDLTKWEAADPVMVRNQRRSYVSDLDQRIRAMMQDRFKLQGSGHYSTTYLRFFPQWVIYDLGGNPGVTEHFRLEVVFGSNVFAPSNTTIVAGTGCKPKSIIRYILGKIGDVPAQWPAQGGLDGDLTKDDLPQLKAWMDANAGGRFNVGAI